MKDVTKVNEKHDYLVPVTSDFSSPQNDPKDVSKEVWFVTGHSRLKAYEKEKWGGGWVISDPGGHIQTPNAGNE